MESIFANGLQSLVRKSAAIFKILVNNLLGQPPKRTVEPYAPTSEALLFEAGIWDYSDAMTQKTTRIRGRI